MGCFLNILKLRLKTNLYPTGFNETNFRGHILSQLWTAIIFLNFVLMWHTGNDKF
jgi:hypothetical protein